MSDAIDATIPKVFISYSWSNADHIEWVINLATFLRNAGIDAILDHWDLKEGNDVHHFMESMVLNPAVKRVLIVCDQVYAEKANARTGGVGSESRIISSELFNKANLNEKFLPLIRERGENGEPCVPVFLKSLLHFDFSDDDRFAESFEKLIRHIFDRPARQKPPLGKMPKELEIGEQTRMMSSLKGRQFIESVNGRRGNPLVLLEAFEAEFLSDLSQMQLRHGTESFTVESWNERIHASIESLHPHKDLLVDVLLAAVHGVSEDQFVTTFSRLFEGMAYLATPENAEGPYRDVDNENLKFFVYESFLHLVAILLKREKWSHLNALIPGSYLHRNAHDRVDSRHAGMFNAFNRSLDEICKKINRRLSLSADLIKLRSTRRDITFSELKEADAIMLLRLAGSWTPWTMVYGGRPELFVRAETIVGADRLVKALGLTNRASLRDAFNAAGVKRTLGFEMFFIRDISSSFNSRNIVME